MNYVLMVGPRLIPTDGMIFKGSKYLLDNARIKVNEYMRINDDEIDMQYPKMPPTHIIILGTPWIWDRCGESVKYKNLQSLLNLFPNAKRLFLGIGSCLPLGKEQDIVNSMFTDFDTTLAFNLLFGHKLTTVVVRDRYTEDVLKRFNPKRLPCPAFYAFEDNDRSTPPERPVMIWYDPTKGISKVDYQKGSPLLKRYLKYFKNAYDTYKPDVYCIDKKEIQLAKRTGLGIPVVIEDIQHAEMILRGASRVISGRVHMAVPAARICQVDLVPVDSRAETINEIASTFRGVSDYDTILREFIK